MHANKKRPPDDSAAPAYTILYHPTFLHHVYEYILRKIIIIYRCVDPRLDGFIYAGIIYTYAGYKM